MMRPGFFRRDVEHTLRYLAGFVVLGAFALTLGWGWQQRQQADEWRELACAYRMSELASRAKFLELDDSRRACERLGSLGLNVRTSRLSAGGLGEPLRY